MNVGNEIEPLELARATEARLMAAVKELCGKDAIIHSQRLALAGAQQGLQEARVAIAQLTEELAAYRGDTEEGTTLGEDQQQEEAP